MAARKAFCKEGLHARPAAVLVKAVKDSGQGVRIGRPGDDGLIDARSIVSVLALDIQPGEIVVLTGESEDLLARLVALLETDQ